MPSEGFADEFKTVKQFFERHSDKLQKEDLRNAMFALKKIEIKCRIPTHQERTASEEAKNTGNNYFKEGRLEESLQMYTKALELDPTNHLAYSNRALVYTKLGQTQEAIDDSLLGIEIDPSFVKFYVRLAVIYSEVDKALANEYIEKGLSYEPDNKMLLDMKAPAESGFDTSAMNSLLKNKGLQDLVQNFVKDKSPEELNTMMNDVLGKLGRQ